MIIRLLDFERFKESLSQDIIFDKDLADKLTQIGPVPVKVEDLADWENRGALPKGKPWELVIDSPTYYSKRLAISMWVTYHRWLLKDGVDTDVLH